MKKFLLSALLILFLIGICFAADPPSWDLLDEDCSDISDWTDLDAGSAVSQVNPAGQFEFDTVAVGASENAYRSRDFGDTPNTFTAEIKIWHDTLGTRANGDVFRFDVRQVDEGFFVRFASDGLFIFDTGSGHTEVGTDLVKSGGSAEWQTWRFLITFGVLGDGVADVYLTDSTHTNEQVGTAIPCSTTGAFTEGETRLLQQADTTGPDESHTDYVKIATGLYAPSAAVTPTAQVIFIE